jgi:hypothetical protein
MVWKSDSVILIKAYKEKSGDDNVYKKYEYYKILLD